jgi:hypothetical protein
MQVKLIRFIVLLLERITAHFVSIHLRPWKFSKHVLKSDYDSYGKYQSEWCILLQGPIITKNSFTLQTILLYRFVYPNAKIILSTWKDEAKKLDKNKLNDLKVDVLLNTKPDNVGISNINLQLVSTIAGINFASDQGVKYVLKTRTDQRVCKSLDFLGHMRNLQTNFPISNDKMENRLIVASTNSFKSRLYGVTDMYMFGSISDMKLFWQIPTEQKSETLHEVKTDPVYFISNKQAEGYLVNHFFNSIDFSPSWSVENSHYFLSQFFCIVDKEQLDLFWLKYERFIESFFFVGKNDAKNWERFEFVDWLKAYILYRKIE